MNPNQNNKKDLALIIGQKPQALVPSLLEASRDVKQAQVAISEQQRNMLEERAHRKTMEVFSKIDTKKTELEIYDNAKRDVVIEEIVVSNEAGRNIVQRKVVKSRNINHLVRSIGRAEVAELIRLLLINVNHYFNVKDGLNSFQVLEIAEQIIDECGDKLFIDELVYIFKKAKSQSTKDNSVYNHLDGSIIFGWIDQHYKNKFIERERAHASKKADTYDIPNLPKGMLSKAIEKLNDGYRENIKNISDVPEEKKTKKKNKE